MIDEYDAMYRTALNEMIRSKLNKTKTSPHILAKALKRISIHIPLLFDKIIKWNLTIKYSKAMYKFMHILDNFWNSQALYAIINLGRNYIILIKHSEFDRMVIINHISIDNNKFKQKFKRIIKAANICGIRFEINKLSDNTLRTNSTKNNISYILTKCIYLCMKTQIIYNFNEMILKNNKTSDIIDNHIIINLLNDTITESIQCLANSLLVPKHTVKFIPNDISDIFLYIKN